MGIARTIERDLIGAGPAGQRIESEPAGNLIVAGAAVDVVVAELPEQNIVAVAAADRVGIDREWRRLGRALPRMQRAERPEAVGVVVVRLRRAAELARRIG